MSASPLLAVLFLGLAGPTIDVPRDAGRLCVLDLDHLGDDEHHDWLGRGLADMLIVRLQRLSDFDVLEREQLRRVLEEHERALRGVVDPPAAVDAARILRADLVLVGAFAVVEERIRIETRLIRVADQGVLTTADWEGALDDVLQAPARLCAELLDGLGRAPDPERLAGSERLVPPTVDVARAYYRGVGAFEDGDYPAALGHYLDGAALDRGFLAIDRAVIRMYYLLGQTEHAVVFADATGRRLEREGRPQQALELTFAAAEHCLESLGEPALAIPFLERMVAAADRHETETRELAADRDELVRSWSPEPDGAARRRLQELRGRLAWGITEVGWWTHAAERADEPPDGAVATVARPEDPAVFMWGTRARRDLARAYAAVGRIDDSLAQYRALIEDFEPLTRLPEDGMRRWNDALRVEGHFMWLRHGKLTGELDREHALREINRLNVVEDRVEFVRSFSNTDVDPRARAASRYDERGHEYFDFACPEGFQIESVRLETEVEGIAEYSFSVPDPLGWPPRIDLGRRVDKFRYTRAGTYREEVVLPPGTELVSLSTSWGFNKYSDSPTDELFRRLFGPGPHEDIRRWSVTFEVAPLEAPAPPAAGDAPRDFAEADGKLIARFAGRGGWEVGAVLRGAAAETYTGEPALDVFAEEWVVCSLDGELFVHHRERPLKVELPVTINTPEREFHPRLVRTHEGAWALVWARGEDERSAQCFVAVSRDFLRWEPPRRLRFAPADAGLRRVEQAGDHDLIAVPGQGYLMVLDHGQVRRSDDLRDWEAPTQVFERDAWRASLSKTADGRLWAVYQTTSDVLEPYDPTDWLTGYHVTGGRRYKHMCEIHVASSRDGVTWQEVAHVVLPGQGSGLWSFPLEDDRIGIGAQFNGRFMKWFATDEPARTLREIPSTLELTCPSNDVTLFVGDGLVACLCPMPDPSAERGTVLMGAGSRRLFEGFRR